jgi:hypothetical protein
LRVGILQGHERWSLQHRGLTAGLGDVTRRLAIRYFRDDDGRERIGVAAGLRLAGAMKVRTTCRRSQQRPDRVLQSIE